MARASSVTGTADRGWLHYLGDHCHGSSGYGGNLEGMRKLYWGKEAYVIRCCGYLFRVDRETFRLICGR